MSQHRHSRGDGRHEASHAQQRIAASAGTMMVAASLGVITARPAAASGCSFPRAAGWRTRPAPTSACAGRTTSSDPWSTASLAPGTGMGGRTQPPPPAATSTASTGIQGCRTAYFGARGLAVLRLRRLGEGQLQRDRRGAVDHLLNAGGLAADPGGPHPRSAPPLQPPGCAVSRSIQPR